MGIVRVMATNPYVTLSFHQINSHIGKRLQVLVKVPARVLYGNYWARGKFEKVM